MRPTPLPILSALCLFLVAPLLPGCGEEEAVQKVEEVYRVKTEISERSSLSNEIITAATIETRNWQSLYFDSGGQVTEVAASEGDTVSKGQILARLDTESQALNVAKAELNLESAQLDLSQAEHKLAQTQALIETGGATQENVYDREQRVLEAQNKVKQGELNLRTQRLNYDKLIIRAPFAGAVNEVNIRVGDLVRGDVSDPDRDLNRRPPLVMIQPTSGMEIRAQIPEGRAIEINQGTQARVVLMEHRDVEMEGEVTQVGATVDRDNRTVHVILNVKAPPGGFPPAVRDGATALITFLTDVRQDAVTVSERALFYFQSGVYVFQVNEDQTVTRLPVVKGVMRGGRVEIESGLEQGVTVARSHLYLLRDGQRIAPLAPADSGEASP